METSIIISLIFAVASIVSSVFFGLVPTIRKNKIERLEKMNREILNDVKLFYEIEDELLNRLQAATGTKKETLKREVRAIISANNDGGKLNDYAKPSVHKKKLNDYK